LPTTDNPADDWYVDAGLGAARFERLPLLAGRHRQPSFDLALDNTPGGVGHRRITHDLAGRFAGMSRRSAPTGSNGRSPRPG
jgi:hypothetical protein